MEGCRGCFFRLSAFKAGCEHAGRRRSFRSMAPGMRVLLVTHPEVTIDPAVPCPTGACRHEAASAWRLSAPDPRRRASAMSSSAASARRETEPICCTSDTGAPSRSTRGWERTTAPRPATSRRRASGRSWIASSPSRDERSWLGAGGGCAGADQGGGAGLHRRPWRPGRRRVHRFAWRGRHAASVRPAGRAHLAGPGSAGRRGGCFFAFDGSAWVLEHGWRDIVPSASDR